MKIAVISSKNPVIYSELELVAKKRGHEVTVLIPPVIELTSLSENQFIKTLLKYDVVYYRAGLTEGVRNHVGEYLKKHGVLTINIGFDCLDLIRNKAFQALQVADLNIALPKTCVGGAVSEIRFEDIVNQLGLPFVVKPPRGSGGKNVEIIQNIEGFNSLSSKVETIFQQYIPHAKEYRCVVIGNQKITYECRIGESSFKANQSFGARYHATEDKDLTDQIEQLVDVMHPRIQLQVYCVDFLHSLNDSKFYLGEINFNPGWKNLTNHTGVCLPEYLINYFEGLVSL